MKNEIETLAERMKQFIGLLPFSLINSDEQARQLAEKDQAEKKK